MDYKAFFAEIAEWVYQANRMAMKHNIDSESFWLWVTESAADVCHRYQDNQLALKQMMMLSEWLEDAYERKADADG